MTDDRIRRPEPERTEPVRDWSTMFKSFGTNGHAAAPEQAAPNAWGAEERDVATGYRVIDEYMRRGAAAARHLSQEPMDARSSNQLFERLVQSATDLGGVWLEMLQTLWSTQDVRPMQGSDPGAFEIRTPPQPARAEANGAEPGPPDAPRPPPAKTRANVGFRVRSTRDVELSATLDAEPGEGPFVVHDLRALDARTPRIEDVRLELDAASGRAVLALSIQDAQPAGVYSGLIVDATSNLPRGTVSVRLFE